MALGARKALCLAPCARLGAHACSALSFSPLLHVAPGGLQLGGCGAPWGLWGPLLCTLGLWGLWSSAPSVSWAQKLTPRALFGFWGLWWCAPWGWSHLVPFRFACVIAFFSCLFGVGEMKQADTSPLCATSPARHAKHHHFPVSPATWTGVVTRDGPGGARRSWATLQVSHKGPCPSRGRVPHGASCVDPGSGLSVAFDHCGVDGLPQGCGPEGGSDGPSSGRQRLRIAPALDHHGLRTAQAAGDERPRTQGKHLLSCLVQCCVVLHPVVESCCGVVWSGMIWHVVRKYLVQCNLMLLKPHVI